MKNIFLRAESVLIFALCFIALCGCQKKTGEQVQKSSSELQENNPLIIGYSIDTLAIERWRRDCDIFLNKARDLGADVIVQNAGNSLEEQNKQIQYLIKRGVKAIVIVPKSAEAFSETIKLARAKNIPVISYDRLLLNSDISLYITIDTTEVGRLMARELLHRAPRGKWFCLFGPEEDFNMTLMKRGIQEELRGKPVQIAIEYYTKDWNYDLSYRKMCEFLQEGKFPDAVIAGNDAVAESIVRAFAENAPGRSVPLAGQDADIAACQNVVRGKQTVTVYKPITLLAERAAEIAVALAQGKSVEEAVGGELSSINNGFCETPAIWLKPIAVTKANMDSVIIEGGFHTREEVYR